MIKNDPINRYHRDPQLGYKLICEFLLLVALLHLPALLAQLPMRRALPLWRQTLQLSHTHPLWINREISCRCFSRILLGKFDNYQLKCHLNQVFFFSATVLREMRRNAEKREKVKLNKESS